MKINPQSRKEKIDLLNDLKNGKISISQLKKYTTGKKVVLSTFLDHLIFFSSIDVHGNIIDRLAQLQEGIFEIELPESPFNNYLKTLPNE